MLTTPENLLTEVCAEREQVAAYLDGELERAANAAFERHLQTCAECAAELAAQRRLLCVLDAAIRAEKEEMFVPRDFARVVTARAQTDLRGLRKPKESRRAFLLCGALGLIALALVGMTAFGDILASLAAFGRAVFRVLSLIGQALMSLCIGIAVILRVVGDYLLAASQARSLFALLFFAVAFVALWRAIEKYHRLKDKSPTESV